MSSIVLLGQSPPTVCDLGLAIVCPRWRCTQNTHKNAHSILHAYLCRVCVTVWGGTEKVGQKFSVLPPSDRIWDIGSKGMMKEAEKENVCV